MTFPNTCCVTADHGQPRQANHHRLACRRRGCLYRRRGKAAHEQPHPAQPSPAQPDDLACHKRSSSSLQRGRQRTMIQTLQCLIKHPLPLPGILDGHRPGHPDHGARGPAALGRDHGSIAHPVRSPRGGTAALAADRCTSRPMGCIPQRAQTVATRTYCASPSLCLCLLVLCVAREQ